jgi:tetratricopeptide (TPR) repeat protein
MMKDRLLKLYYEGQFDLLKIELAKSLTKYKRQSEESKSFLVGLLININENERALRYLEKELSYEQLLNAHEELILRQAYLGSIKAFFNSFDVAIRIFKKINLVLKDKNKLSDKTLKKILILMSGQLYFMEFYKEVADLKSLYPHKESKNENSSIFEFLFELNQICSRTYINQNKIEDTLSFFSELSLSVPNFEDKERTNFLIFFHQSLLKLNYKIQDNNFLDKANLYIDQNLVPASDLAYIYFMMGMNEFFQKNNDRAKIYLHKALEFSSINTDRLLFYFWLEQIDPKELDPLQKVFIRCASFRSTPSFLMGNRFEKSLSYHHDVYDFAREVELSHNDSWMISNNNIIDCSYSNYEINENLLDLKAGIVIKNKNVTYILSQIRAKCLRVIISHGKEGVNISTLVDALFDEQVYYYHSALLRVKNLLVELKKLGFKLRRVNNIIYYQFEKNNFHILFPKNHEHIGVFCYIKKISPNLINSTILQDVLNIKSAQASLLIKAWKEAELIEPIRNGKYGHYLAKN